MLADMFDSFLLVPFRLASLVCLAPVAVLAAIVPYDTIRAWTSITECHLPAISTSESRNLSYKDS